MKSIKISFFITIHLCLLSLPGWCQQQDAIGQMEKIRSFYTGPELKHIQGNMILKDADNGTQVDKVDFEYWLADKQLFSKLNYIEILSNDKVYVMVNNKAKSIYARKQTDLAHKPSPGFFDADQLKKLIAEKNANLKMEKDGNDAKIIMSGLKNYQFSTVTIYSRSDGKIEKIQAMVNAPAGDDKQQLLLEIIYRNTSKEIMKDKPDVFSSVKYLDERKKGHFTYTQAYQNYTKL